MSDLISRNALLNAFNDVGIQITFDLPVEEILGEDVDIDDFAMLAQDAIQAYKKMVIDTIKNQPTAYDIDKVFEELKEAKTISVDIGYGTIIDTIRKDVVLEIVKQGAVSDDVCEWKSGKSNDEWKPSCEPNSTYNVFGVSWFRKCPYCGKKMKVVE